MTVAIFGTGGHGREVLEILLPFKTHCVFLCDYSPVGGIINGAMVVGGKEMLTDKEFLEAYDIIIAVGDNKLRGVLSRLVRASGGRLARAIHPTAIIQTLSVVGEGTVVFPYAIIGPNVSIGDYCIINKRVTVAHDAVIHHGVSISDCSSLTTEVGEEAFIGLNVSVIPKTPIGARAIVGAGSVVTREVPPDTTVVGVPARVIKNRGTHG